MQRDAGSCAAPLSVPICASLTAASQARWLANSNGRKRDFFKQVQRATAPHNLTGKGRGECNTLVNKDAVKTRVAIIGDSIAQELMAPLQVLLRPAMSATYIEVADLETDTFSGDVNATVRVASMQGNTTFAEKVKPVHGAFPPAYPLWKLLAAERWDAVFVGALGLHRLFRHVQWENDASRLEYGDHNERVLHSPYRAHRELVSTWLRRFVCFSRALRAPLVFVGTLPIDEQVLLLEPPKFDWGTFHEMGLSQVMAFVERELDEKFAAERTGAELRFLHPSDLAHACPGARCDGMHFGSFLTKPGVRRGAPDGCYPSPALWCPLLEHFLRCRMPHLLGRHEDVAPRGPTRAVEHRDVRAHRMHQCLRVHMH